MCKHGAIFTGFVLLTIQAPLAGACQVCVVTLSYNLFPFTPLWLCLLGVWLLLSTIAVVQARRGGKVRLETFTLILRPQALLLVAMVLMFLLGLQLVALLVFPLLLRPYLGPARWHRNERDRRRRVLAPRWFVPAAHGVMLALVLSIPFAYLEFPTVMNEPLARERVSETKQQLARVAAILNLHRDSSGDYPALADVPELSGLMTDPFGYIPQDFSFANRAMAFPFVFMNRGGYPYQSGRPIEPFQYVREDDGFILVSRGPDGDFSWDGDFPSTATIIQYDPTNGILSWGDVFVTSPPIALH